MAAMSLSISIPVAELVLSGAFSLLVFSYVVLDVDRMMSYYFGMVFGFLTYILVLGFPGLGR